MQKKRENPIIFLLLSPIFLSLHFTFFRPPYALSHFLLSFTAKKKSLSNTTLTTGGRSLFFGVLAQQYVAKML